MSIFRFSVEFRFFFFLLSAFLKIIFRFFLKSRRPLGTGNMTPAAMQLVIVQRKTVRRLLFLTGSLFLTYSRGCLEDWGGEGVMWRDRGGEGGGQVVGWKSGSK